MTRRIPPVRRLLMDAKALIAKPENWIQGTFSRNVAGKAVPTYDIDACQFCASGALYHATKLICNSHYVVARKMLGDFVPARRLISFNDAPTTTHPMVVKLFNKAIRRAKEQGI